MNMGLTVKANAKPSASTAVGNLLRVTAILIGATISLV